MHETIRPETAGATYFFSLTLQDRSRRWLVDHVDDLRQAFRDVRARHAFDIEAIVVLPEHLHAIWRLPVDDADFSTRWMLIKQGFTQALQEKGLPEASPDASRRVKGEKPVWQRRFWEHQLRDEEDLRRHVDYIHFNPVKHGWVMRAADWPFSSIHRYVRDGSLPADWGISAPIDGQFGE